jgi:hypothetical protein
MARKLVVKAQWLVAEAKWTKDGDHEKLVLHGRFDTEEAAIAHAEKGLAWEGGDFCIVPVKEVFFDFDFAGNAEDLPFQESKAAAPPVIS